MSDPAASARAHASEPLPRLGIALLAMLAVLWGLHFPILKIAFTEIPVLTFRATTLISGGLALLLIARARGLSLHLPRGERRPLVLTAIFGITGWHLASAYGLTMIEAGVGVIIAHVMPVLAAPLSVLILGEAMTVARIVALAIGVGGLAALVGPDMVALGTTPVGALMMLAAAASWALGTVLIKYYQWTVNVGVLVGWQLLFGAAPILVGAVALDPWTDPLALSPGPLFAITYTILLPMVVCHWAYFKLVRIFPASIAAIGTLAVPVVGVISSNLILGEHIGVAQITALVLVTSAITLVVWTPAKRPER